MERAAAEALASRERMPAGASALQGVFARVPTESKSSV